MQEYSKVMMFIFEPLATRLLFFIPYADFYKHPLACLY